LLHVVAKLIGIFLASCQLVLLSALPKFYLHFCCQKRCTRQFSGKISSLLMSIVTEIKFYPENPTEEVAECGLWGTRIF